MARRRTSSLPQRAAGRSASSVEAAAAARRQATVLCAVAPVEVQPGLNDWTGKADAGKYLSLPGWPWAAVLLPAAFALYAQLQRPPQISRPSLPGAATYLSLAASLDDGLHSTAVQGAAPS